MDCSRLAFLYPCADRERERREREGERDRDRDTERQRDRGESERRKRKRGERDRESVHTLWGWGSLWTSNPEHCQIPLPPQHLLPILGPFLCASSPGLRLSPMFTLLCSLWELEQLSKKSELVTTFLSGEPWAG